MIRSQQPAGASTSPARAQRDQLSNSVRAIDREHRQLVGSLDAEQQRVLQDRVRQTNRGLEELEERHRSLDRALADSAADSRQITERAKELDRAMKEWQKQYRKLGAEMGAEAG
jgi:predicted RNase H-like nuclease (RuvC/YqgF family)